MSPSAAANGTSHCLPICGRSSTVPPPRESKAINPAADEITKAALKRWVDAKGELINLPPDEQAQMFKTLASVGADVAKTKPHVQEAYKIVTDAVARLK